MIDGAIDLRPERAHFNAVPKGETRVANHDLAWMQFTGLHDKNGTEIYEGDILRWNNRYVGVVRYIEGSFVIGSDKFAVFDGNGETVIGNIYENPELLKGV